MLPVCCGSLLFRDRRHSFIFIPQRERVTGTGNRAIGVCCAKVNKRPPRSSFLGLLLSRTVWIVNNKHMTWHGPCPNTHRKCKHDVEVVFLRTSRTKLKFYLPILISQIGLRKQFISCKVTCPVDTQCVVCYFFRSRELTEFKVPIDDTTFILMYLKSETFRPIPNGWETADYPVTCVYSSFI